MCYEDGGKVECEVYDRDSGGDFLWDLDLL